MKELLNKLKSGPALGAMVAVALGYQLLQKHHSDQLLKNAKYVGTQGPAPKDLIGTVATNAPDAASATDTSGGSRSIASVSPATDQPLSSPLSEANTSWDQLPTPQAAVDSTSSESESESVDQPAVLTGMAPTIAIAPKAIPINEYGYSDSMFTSDNSNLPPEVQSLVNQPELRSNEAPVIRTLTKSDYGPRILYVKTHSALMRFQLTNKWTLTSAKWKSILKRISLSTSVETTNSLNLKSKSLTTYEEELDNPERFEKDFSPNDIWYLESVGDACETQELREIKLVRSSQSGKCHFGKLVGYYRYKQTGRSASNTKPKFYLTSVFEP